VIRASVIISVYNAENLIERAVKSALHQQLHSNEYEILVVDDGSTDRTLERLKPYEGQISLLKLNHGGLSKACNAALAKIAGPYFIRLDADDTLAPKALSTLIGDLDKDPEVGLVYADWMEIDPAGHENRCVVDPFNLFRLLACGVLFRTSIAREIGGYNDLLFEEYDFMLRYLRVMPKTHHVAEALYNYFRHGDNMTQKSGYWDKGWKEFIAKWGEGELSKWNFHEVYQA